MNKLSRGPALYELQQVGKTYRTNGGSGLQRHVEVRVLRDVSLPVFSGEFLCIVGRSGEGKSTLLNLLGALDVPSSGTLLYKGKRLDQYSRVAFRRHEVGFIFQMFHLLPNKSALENVAVGLTMTGAPRGASRAAACTWLERLGLESRLEHRPDELSGGEKQRVAIARAMVKEPNVLLADEPTGNLDKGSRDEVLQAIKRMQVQHGKTVVLITHQLEDAAKYGDRVLKLDGGTIVNL